MADRPEDPIEELLPAYALNALEPEERERVETALERDPRSRAMLADLLTGLSVLHSGHQPAIPSAALRERVMAVRRPSDDAAPHPSNGIRSTMAFWGLAASLVLAVVSMGTVAFVQQKRVGDLETEMQVLVEEAARTDFKLQRSVELAALATQPGASTATMLLPLEAPQPPREPMFGILFSRADGKRVLWVSNLDPLPEGMVYQAWLWEDRNHAYSVAVFEADELGQALVPMWMPLDAPLPGRWLTVQVSPEGGSITPGDEKVLWGSVEPHMPIETNADNGP